jgi:hypothetical protein
VALTSHNRFRPDPLRGSRPEIVCCGSFTLEFALAFDMNSATSANDKLNKPTDNINSDLIDE